MATARVVINNAGVTAILRSSRVLDDLKRRGEAIAETAGVGYEVQTWTGRRRVRVTVRTATTRARATEAREHRLLSAISAGRR